MKIHLMLHYQYMSREHEYYHPLSDSPPERRAPLESAGGGAETQYRAKTELPLGLRTEAVVRPFSEQQLLDAQRLALSVQPKIDALKQSMQAQEAELTQLRSAFSERKMYKNAAGKLVPYEELTTQADKIAAGFLVAKPKPKWNPLAQTTYEEKAPPAGISEAERSANLTKQSQIETALAKPRQKLFLYEQIRKQPATFEAFNQEVTKFSSPEIAQRRLDTLRAFKAHTGVDIQLHAHEVITTPGYSNIRDKTVQGEQQLARLGYSGATEAQVLFTQVPESMRANGTSHAGGDSGPTADLDNPQLPYEVHFQDGSTEYSLYVHGTRLNEQTMTSQGILTPTLKARVRVGANGQVLSSNIY